MFLTYIVPLYRTTYRIVNEKETRSRESMKMMGLTDSSYWLSWLTYFAMVVTMISLISTLMLNGLLKTDGGVLFVLFWLYGISLFGYVLIVQALFNKARTAGGFVATIYFIASFFDNLVNQPYHSYSQKTAASLLSPVALNRCVYVLSVAEGTVGLNWSNINDEYQNYVFTDGMLMMLCAGIVTCLLGLYFDNVIQQTYGTAKSPCFCFSRKHWGCSSSKKQSV